MDTLRGPGESFHRVSPLGSSIDWLWIRPDMVRLHGNFELTPNHPEYAPRGDRDQNRREGWVTLQGITALTWRSGPDLMLPPEGALDAPGRSRQGDILESLSLPDGVVLGVGCGILEVRCTGLDLLWEVPDLPEVTPLPPPMQEEAAEDLLPAIERLGLCGESWRLQAIRASNEPWGDQVWFTWGALDTARAGTGEPRERTLVGTEVRHVRWRELRVFPDPTGRFPPYAPRLTGFRRLGERFAAWGPWGSLEWEASGYRVEGGETGG